MTGDTGDHLSGKTIKYAGPDRMGKLTLGLVALNTYAVAVPFEHGQIAAAVHFVAATAVLDIRVPESTLPVSGHGLPVA